MKQKGWQDEKHRHALASRGIKTSRGYQFNTYSSTKHTYKARGYSDEEQIFELPKMTIKDVASVYVGRQDGCRCGCLGDYTYPSDRVDEAGEDRGYKINDDEVDDSRIQRVINKAKKLEKRGIDVGFKDKDNTIPEYYNVENEKGRVYTIYMR